MDSSSVRGPSRCSYLVLATTQEPDISIIRVVTLPDNSLANLEKWAAGVSVPTYLIDDQTAIQVVDGGVDVVSEGHWKLFTQE